MLALDPHLPALAPHRLPWPPASPPPAGSHLSCLQPAGAMTEQPQEGFAGSVEAARAWMKAVQERLQTNDNTQGPRAALEARLRETEVGRGPAGRPRGWRGPSGSAPVYGTVGRGPPVFL